jgi:hypothetical protein
VGQLRLQPRQRRQAAGTVAGSIWKVRQKDVLAAISVWSEFRNKSGSLDETTTAMVLAASKWAVGSDVTA